MEKHKVYIKSRIVSIGRLLDISRIRAAVYRALVMEGVDRPCEVSILITNDDEIQRINRAFRDVDAPTDVLSFPMTALTPGRLEPAASDVNRDTGRVTLGDIVLSYDRIREQARRFGQSIDREADYLVIHSVLHLLGYDHTDEGPDKCKMRAREKAILGETGISG